ncbi:3-oxo-tetronate kinase [Ferrimonas balearica]|uniref:3-oxo-tetronate kinase n=1 Tax=Ferrimonas balearica TaxID=44012 RepID=UPI001F15FD2A|nr:3-oxo-tetronate kinase [Ferrimonas balearica]MBY6094783.1 four-carbon acid sugar kinase family protein [Ferrimonas balearica]
MIRVGVIADDFTGATDIASFLVANGLRAVQFSGIPQGDVTLDTDAVVISLKSRSCPVDQAVADSLAALAWLKQHGAEQIYFKYCSTFDSTAEGNIGPVTDALMDALDTPLTILCPSLPVNGRSVYMGHLFVGEQLLSDSGMKDHPVTPMTDSSLIRLMNAQASGTTGLVNASVIDAGVEAVQARYAELRAQGHRYAVVDTLNERHLETLGQSVQGMALVTGGSGLALGIARNLAPAGANASDTQAAGQPQAGRTVVLSGSCSVMTNAQVAAYRAEAESMVLDVEACLNDAGYVDTLLNWVLPRLDNALAPMLYATAEPQKLKAIQTQYGAEQASHAVEQTFGRLAARLKAEGVTNFIVAGGETSGIVTQSLNVDAFHIGPPIAPGVPWVRAVSEPISLTLKSGNFGQERFFFDAQAMILEAK